MQPRHVVLCQRHKFSAKAMLCNNQCFCIFDSVVFINSLNGRRFCLSTTTMVRPTRHLLETLVASIVFYLTYGGCSNLQQSNYNFLSKHPCRMTNLQTIFTVTTKCTRVGILIVATIYLQLIQNRYMFRSFTVLQCSHQHCVRPVASDVEVVGYL